MPRHVGQRFLHDAVDRDVDRIAERAGITFHAQQARGAGAFFPAFAQLLQGSGQAQRVEVGGPQAAQHVAHQLVQALRCGIGTVGRGQHAGPVVGGAVAQARGFDADRRAALAKLVVQFARQREALAFLQRDQLPCKFTVMFEQIGDARFGLGPQHELGLHLAAPPQRVPGEATGQHGQRERQFVDLPALQARQALRERFLQLQR